MFSLTQGSILFMVAGTLLAKAGFSDTCSNELITNLPLVMGGIGAWVGRMRAGGVTWFGSKIQK